MRRGRMSKKSTSMDGFSQQFSRHAGVQAGGNQQEGESQYEEVSREKRRGRFIPRA
jgi:hypothetical protein